MVYQLINKIQQYLGVIIIVVQNTIQLDTWEDYLVHIEQIKC